MSLSITVLMSAYNAEKHIREAIDSILSQTYQDFDFIIINDGSTDATGSIIKSYRDPRIKLTNNDKNLGLAKSLNIGLELAQGKYIARMDADDISLPNRLKVQFEFMEKNKDVDAAGSWFVFFGDKKDIVKTRTSHSEIKDVLFFTNCIAHPTVIMRKSSLDKYKIKYDEAFSCSQDYELWCRVVGEIKLANIPEVLLKYRIHEAQIGAAKRKEQDKIANLIRQRNLEKAGVILDDKEKEVYFDVLNKNYYPKNKEDLFFAASVSEKIIKMRKTDEKYYDGIKVYLNRVAMSGIESKVTSFQLYCTLLLRRNVFETFRSKIGYLYYCIRNWI